MIVSASVRRVRGRVAAVGGAALMLGLMLGAMGAMGAGIAPASAAVPSDDSSGQCTAATRIPSTPPALNVLQSQLAWGVTRGAGVVVAVVDSGVDADNPHLSGALIGGTDLVGDGAGRGGYADTDGHGTAIAGIIAARQIDGSGVVGLAPESRILSVRVFGSSSPDQQNPAAAPSVARLAAGIRYAADHRAQVINVSLSTAQDAPELRDAVAYATAHGSLVVASAGNRDSSLNVEKDSADGPRFPADDPGALGVTATATSGVVTSASIHGPQVDLAAPGMGVLSTSSAGGDCVFAPDTPATSFATAYVSAAAALVASEFPQETPAQWAYRLEASAVRANPDARDDVSGWGVLQPYDALTLVPGPGVRGPKSPFPGAGEPPAARPPSDSVTVSHRASPESAAQALALLGAIAAAAVLAVLGAIGILRVARRGDGVAAIGTGDDGTGADGTVADGGARDADAGGLPATGRGLYPPPDGANTIADIDLGDDVDAPAR